MVAGDETIIGPYATTTAGVTSAGADMDTAYVGANDTYTTVYGANNSQFWVIHIEGAQNVIKKQKNGFQLILSALAYVFLRQELLKTTPTKILVKAFILSISIKIGNFQKGRCFL